MDLTSNKVSLLVLGATAMIFSRALFFFFKDAEGPNLLIVAGLAVVLFLLSLAVRAFLPSTWNGFKRLSVLVGVQIVAVIGLYFCMR